MCGIFGIVSSSASFKSAAVSLIRDAQYHRGPDAQSSFIDENLALAHQRLSMLIYLQLRISPFSRNKLSCVLMAKSTIINL